MKDLKIFLVRTEAMARDVLAQATVIRDEADQATDLPSLLMLKDGTAAARDRAMRLADALGEANTEAGHEVQRYRGRIGLEEVMNADVNRD